MANSKVINEHLVLVLDCNRAYALAQIEWVSALHQLNHYRYQVLVAREGTKAYQHFTGQLSYWEKIVETCRDECALLAEKLSAHDATLRDMVKASTRVNEPSRGKIV